MRFVKPGNYFFLVPIIAFIPWYGMLITMLVCWAAQGHPIYWFMHTDQFPVFISDIGATNLRPLFIACSGWQGIGYVVTVALEFTLRNWFIMNPWFIVDERNLIFAAFILGLIGELGLLFCSIWSTASFPNVHTAMVSIFIIFMFLSIVCLTAQYYSMGRHYAMIHYKNKDDIIYDEANLYWYQWRGHVWNKFTISGVFKTIWLLCAVVWAICFATVKDNSISAKFEWLLAFWLGLIFIILAADFYLGSRWKFSKYFPRMESYGGYYKFEKYLYQQNKDQLTEKTEPVSSSQSSENISSSLVSINEEGSSDRNANEDNSNINSNEEYVQNTNEQVQNHYQN